MKEWAATVRATTLALAHQARADAASFEPLSSFAAAVPASGGALRVEWVAARDSEHFGMTVFEHGTERTHLEVARALCATRFDAAALKAWDKSAEELTSLAVTSHVGLAWDKEQGYRLKLFIGRGPGLSEAARLLGLNPAAELAGVGCDFWNGGRYRPRRYLRARDFASLAALAAPEPAPTWPIPERGHAVLTLTEACDALGHKTTFSVIFPPQATLATLATYPRVQSLQALQGLAAELAPFVLRPSALELDRYRSGREELELLVTLGTPASPAPGASA
jgi:hypothetical protein